uniref:Uncharacterized protein n=1 Tax=Rhizophora mucronata TaxID=61149 RepID=A0A2P2N911_RHIMU
MDPARKFLSPEFTQLVPNALISQKPRLGNERFKRKN